MLVNYQGWLRFVGKDDNKENFVEFLKLAGAHPIDLNSMSNYFWFSRFALEYRVEV